MLLELFGVFTAAALADFAWLRWQAAADRGALAATPAWSVAVAALGLVGLGGALRGPWYVLAYLAGNAAGSCAAAYFHRRSRG